MIILIACDGGCDNRFGTMAAYEAHRPDGACLPPADAGLTERVHRDRGRCGQGTVRYWVAADEVAA